MSFSITSYTPGREHQETIETSGSTRDSLPFPTEAWRRMLTPVRAKGAGRQEKPRTLHPAEIALAEVEKRFERATISINEAMEADRAAFGSDDWPPRAA
ncbi:MAG TPA: hypothetical protein VK176_16105 [Phycisphaerales bacterium]|nr:hypothetical protein [Phycisphaerales bacterium]